MSPGNPPWYERDENGEIMILEVPAGLKTHPEIIRRGLELEPIFSCKIGVVYKTCWFKEPVYYIKIVDTDTEEAAVFQRLSRYRDPRNHTIPGELTPPDAGHPLLITPSLCDYFCLEVLGESGSKLYCAFSMFLQLMEGIEFMHDLQIVHMDICTANVVASGQGTHHYPGVEPGKVYFIDFGSSLQLPLGPGKQHAITLPPSQYRLAYNITTFDPYSWDVYCAALMMEETLECYKKNPPLIARLYVNWLKGEERGCTAACRCRPSARRARRVLSAILWGVRAWELLSHALHGLKSLRLPFIS
ncbi:hypothetical protein ONZ51_g8669 [Trametes cubensis]|uniref:Protein kinase domain-containing protein n=1 Tax=Trametes cubensis TaxID=1111947 RepID=A0AAD7TQC2_9APHY|nr:hypothetical protein ONZ51_g8669 [Trametes cubensis]